MGEVGYNVKVSCVLEVISSPGCACCGGTVKTQKYGVSMSYSSLPVSAANQSFAHLLQRVPDSRPPLDITISFVSTKVGLLFLYLFTNFCTTQGFMWCHD